MSVQVIQGDARQILEGLSSHSVHCVITSPPYWQLRDYGVAEQIGLEATPAEYVAALLTVFREVWRVLRADGTLWLNLGDCYATGAGKVGDCPGGGEQGERWKGNRGAHTANNSGKNGYMHAAMGPLTQPNRMPLPGLKAKDLVGIPWRVAFALQEDGWYLRSDIIWSKPNPLPESVADRPTKSHEYVFLLTKEPRYFYDADAIREPSMPERAAGRNSSCVNDKIPVTRKKQLKAGPLVGNHGTMGHDGNGLRYDRVYNNPLGRNKRSVWTIATTPYPEAHFATFPRALVEPCILAGTSEAGCCPACLTPWKRIIERTDTPDPSHCGSRFDTGKTAAARAALGPAQKGDRFLSVHRGWEPGCSCDAGSPRRCTVLDPFAGSGTVGAVALKHRRDAILIELNPSYVELIHKRLDGVQVALPLEELADAH